MPALEDYFAANWRALVLIVELIRFEIQRGQQRSNVRIMPHQQGDFRRFRLIGDQRFINIFHQRFGDVLRHLGGGKQRVLIAVFQLRQHTPLLVSLDLTPGHLISRETFVILQRERIHQRVTHFQRTGHAWLFFIVGTERIFRVRQRADFFLFAGRRIGVVRHLLQQLIAF